MILDKKVEFVPTGKSIKYYKELGYNSEYGKKLTIKVEDLTSGSNIKINVRCDICHKEKKIFYVEYIRNTKKLTEPFCCCNKCAWETKNKKTNLELYGVEYSIQNKEVQQKSKKSCLEKYGAECSLQNENIKNKIKATNVEKYGVKNPMQNDDIKEKTKQTNITIYGGNSPMCNKEVREKSQQTCFKHYGVNNPTQHPDIFKKQQNSLFNVLPYKDTDLTSQAGYELYFLQLMDKHGFINDLSIGKSYNYILNDKKHVYFSDYLFRNNVIEIKSTWTYNKNGIDQQLELENETKWKTVRDKGDNIIVLMSKKEIKEYVQNLIV